MTTGRSPFLVYYGHDEKLVERLAQTDLLIFESRGWSEQQLAQLRAEGGKLIGYLSPFAWPDWLGPVKWWWGAKERDEEWNAWWLTLASRGWRHRVGQMWKSLRPGLDGLFFDNLDRLERDPKSLKPFLALLQNIRREWPGTILIGNRGFQHWSSLGRHFDGVLFENLTDSAFSAADRRWVEEKLLELQGSKVYALDYETRKVEAEASRLRSLFPKMAYYCAPDESLQSVRPSCFSE
jgi:hypothetical protein